MVGHLSPELLEKEAELALVANYREVIQSIIKPDFGTENFEVAGETYNLYRFPNVISGDDSTLFLAERICELIQTGKYGSYFEVGTGLGLGCCMAAKAGLEVWGCDIYLAAFLNTKLNLAEINPKHLQRISNSSLFESVPEDQTFDLIASNFAGTPLKHSKIENNDYLIAAVTNVENWYQLIIQSVKHLSSNGVLLLETFNTFEAGGVSWESVLKITQSYGLKHKLADKRENTKIQLPDNQKHIMYLHEFRFN